MKKIFWILAVGACASAALAVSLGRAADIERPTGVEQAAR